MLLLTAQVQGEKLQHLANARVVEDIALALNRFATLQCGADSAEKANR